MRIGAFLVKMSASPCVFVVAVALVNQSKKILIAERPLGKSLEGLWEFPGGKVYAEERPEEALVRECEEELGIRLCPKSLTPLTFASHPYEQFHLLMLLYVSREWEGPVTPRENQKIMWVNCEDLSNYPMPPADAPLIPHLRRYLS